MLTAILAASLVACPPPEATEWSRSDGGNGHWYLAVLHDSAIPWTAALSLAGGMGGHLATLTTEAENLWVFETIASDPALWTGPQGPYLGGFQAGGACEPACGWHWVDGSEFSFAAWSPGNPSDSFGCEEYLHYSCGPSGCPSPTWNDICNSNPDWPLRAFIVEWEPCVPPCDADFNSSGAVDGNDLGILLGFWGPVGPFAPPDLNDDGIVDGSDLGSLLGAWGPCPE